MGLKYVISKCLFVNSFFGFKNTFFSISCPIVCVWVIYAYIGVIVVFCCLLIFIPLSTVLSNGSFVCVVFECLFLPRPVSKRKSFMFKVFIVTKIFTCLHLAYSSPPPFLEILL